MSSSGKNFLLTGARFVSTLDLARQLDAAGHRVVVVDTADWHVCRVSNAVKRWYSVPSPKSDSAGFIDSLASIVQAEKIDYLVPTYEETIYLAKQIGKLPPFCKVFCDSFEKLHRLHNKWRFYQLLEELHIPAPKTYLISSENELDNLPRAGTYALKPCYSRASLSLKKLSPGNIRPALSYDKKNPWIAQEWLAGKQFCSYSICQNGQVKAHALYPVQFAIDGHSCVNFEAVEHSKIFEWITRFVSLIQFTGQIGFDFFETIDGNIFAIECNPRATNGLVLFHPSDRIDRAIMGDKELQIICPGKGFKKQILLGMAMYGWRTANDSKKILNYAKTLFRVPDIVFNRNDLKPGLLSPFICLLYWATCLKSGKNLPASFVGDSNWDGEEAALNEG